MSISGDKLLSRRFAGDPYAWRGVLIMSYPPPRYSIILTILLVPTILYADEPPANSIPIIAMKTGQDATCEDVTLEFLCELSWNHFDGIWLEGWSSWDVMQTIFGWCDSTGSYVVFAPARYQTLGHLVSENCWARFDSTSLRSDSAFFHPNSDGSAIDSVQYAITMIDEIVERCSTLADNIEDYDCVWYYDVFDEAPSWQLRRAIETDEPYDEYIPNVFTQDTSMCTLAPDGIFSWLMWKSDSIDSDHYVAIDFGSLHSFVNWAGVTMTFGTSHTHATAVRAYMNTMYQAYSDSIPLPAPQNNSPELIEYNAYPFRLVGTQYQEDSSITVTLGDSLATWMLDHYQTIMDSTFIPAWENDGFPVHFYPQGFGRNGGLALWEIEDDPPDTSVSYTSYTYRIPSPAEFRMQCNLALMMQARGIFPYSIRSYSNYDGDDIGSHDTGLLDEDLIPLDAPYEEWVYRERPAGDFCYAPPDSIPPWTDVDGDDFDPLYELPDRPINVPGSQRNEENYLLWKFKPYGRLWNSMRETMGEIAIIAPELASLWWWDGREYDAEIVSGDSTNLPTHYVSPEVRVFTDSSESSAYLFYVNRHCRTGKLPFLISVDEGDFPSGTVTELLLDHSRRFIIPVSDTGGIHSWMDTLQAGQGRLVEFVDSTVTGDIRITAPDVFARYPGAAVDIRDLEFTVADTVVILADFFNMGTDSLEDVIVYCVDLSDGSSEVGRDTLDFEGLSLSGGTTDEDRASFRWVPGSDDIGVHVMEISTVSPVYGELDTLDNSARAVFLIEPRNYARTELHDPWDMTEATGSPPAWYTDDVDSLTGWNATFTDSISGMFEGTVSDPSDTNRVYLNTGSGSSDWINTIKYHELRLAGIAERALSIYLGWTDTRGREYVVDTGEDLTAEWAEIAPVYIDDLSPRWDDDDAPTFWLEFRGSNMSTDVRIGWVRLTE